MIKFKCILASVTLAFTANSQNWTPIPGMINKVNAMEGFNNSIYMTDWMGVTNGTNVYQWDGNSTTTVATSTNQLRDVAVSGTEVMAAAFVKDNNILTSSSGWLPVAVTSTVNIGTCQVAWFNNKVYDIGHYVRSFTPGQSSWTFHGSSLAGQSLSNTRPVFEAKVFNNRLYYCCPTGIYYITTSSNTPVQFSSVSVQDFTMLNSDMYFSNYVTKEFVKFDGVNTTTILSSNYASSFCEVYNGKVYFTYAPSATSAVSLYVYDPAQSLSATNPSAIAELSSTTEGITNLCAYNGDLYVGGTFTSINTLSGAVNATNLVKYSETIYPVSSFSVSSSAECVPANVSVSDQSTNATSLSWSVTPTASITNSTSQNTSIAFNSAGTYTVYLTATNTVGSSTSSQVVTINPLPTVSVTAAQDNVCAESGNGTYVGLNGLPFGGNYSGAYVTSTMFGVGYFTIPPSAGTYTVMYTYTDTNSCTSSSTDVITVSVCTGLEDITMAYNFKLTSVDGFINVKFDNKQTLEIYDITGRQLYTSTSEEHSVRVGFGIYIVRSKDFSTKVICIE